MPCAGGGLAREEGTGPQRRAAPSTSWALAISLSAIADGSYKVDAGAIADKLIANAQEVLGAARR